jgi:hypothetical protein
LIWLIGGLGGMTLLGALCRSAINLKMDVSLRPQRLMRYCNLMVFMANFLYFRQRATSEVYAKRENGRIVGEGAINDRPGASQ